MANRRWFLALAPAALIAAACGGGGSTPTPTATAPTTGTPAGIPTVKPGSSVPAGQPSADNGQPAPTKVPDDAVALQVISGGKQYRPKLSEFKALPQVDIDVAGKKQTGVSLAALAKQVPDGPTGFVTIQGLSSDLKRVGTIRYPLADVGATTVLVTDGDGHISLVSSTIPELQWIQAISAIVLT